MSDFSSQPPEDDYPENLSFRKQDPQKYKRAGGRPPYEKSMEGRQAAALFLLSQGHECKLEATWTHPDLENFKHKFSLGPASAEGLAFILKNALPCDQERFDSKLNSFTFDWNENKKTKDEERRESSKRARELEHYQKLGQVCNMLRCVIRVPFSCFTTRKSCVCPLLFSLPEKGRLLQQYVIRVSSLVSLPENYNA